MKKSVADLKKKSKTIITVYSIFISIVTTLSLLKKYSIINSNFYLIPFYIIIAIITYGIIIILYSQTEKAYRKKASATSLILSVIGIILLVFYGTAIDLKKELIDFSKNATKIEALIIDIDKNQKFVRDKCVNGIRHGTRCKSTTSDEEWYAKDYYEVYFTYELEYIVENEIYTSKYNDDKQKFDYKEQTTNYKSKYNKGDYITIYYDNDNPENIKGNFSLNFGMIYFFEIIVILFHLYYFIKHKKIIKEIKK